MPEQRERIPLTVSGLALVFEGLELVAEAATDPEKLKQAVELAGQVRQALDRAKRRQAVPGGDG